MDCPRKKGVEAWPHRVQQNGLGADFMTVPDKNGRQYRVCDKIGLLRYLVNFDGHYHVDFEVNGK